MSDHRFVESDAIKPTRIEHCCEEIWDGDRLEQQYNYLVYDFDCEGVRWRARYYLGDDAISILAAFGADGTPIGLVARECPEVVLAYLRRRFTKIDVLTEEGYETLWAT